ncbi:peptide chain release factor 1 [Burkholderia pseudomallei]|nr:peptide chain release factor 1 [Burkholderia pseudomallei]
MVELSLKTRGQGRGGGANEFGPARARHRPLRPFGQATFCSGVPTPGAAAARSPAGCAGGVARYRSAWGKSLACRLPLAACRLPPAACRLPLAACRLPPAACRLPLAACRLPPTACRLSLIACRSSRDAGRATLASGSGETHDRASCAARGHARGHTGIPACPRPPQRFPPREKRANPPIFVMSPCEARNKTRAAFVFIHMGRRPPRRARDARPPDRCAARRRKWNRYGCFQPHARCSR